MKAAQDAGEEYNDPVREDNILGRNKTRLAFWDEHLKDPTAALDKAQGLGPSPLWRERSTPKFVGKASLGGRLVLLGSDG